MTWTVFQVVWRLMSPLHVGAGLVGNVQRTRPYLTGKAAWGALTARMARDQAGSRNDYARIGAQVNEELAFSYFYPAPGAAIDGFPWDQPEAEFQWRYLNTYAATALDYERSAAAESSLHETEYLMPFTREGAPVFLSGYILEREAGALQWQSALERVQLGGERARGWGRVRLETLTRTDDLLFDAWQVNVSTPRPILSSVRDTPRVFAHTRTKDIASPRGEIEPLVGRETNDAGAHGQLLRGAVVCWAPGSEIEKCALRLGMDGIWGKAE